MKLNELAYNTINIMDEPCIVEIAFSPATKTIHLFDQQQAVEPQYDFASKSYKLSDDFFHLVPILRQKGYMPDEGQQLDAWMEAIEWRFYCSQQMIKVYKQGEMSVIPRAVYACLSKEARISQNYYNRYVEKLMG